MSYRRFVYIAKVKRNPQAHPSYLARTNDVWEDRGVYGTLERAKESTGITAWESDGGTYIADSTDGRYVWSIERVEVR